MAVSFARAPVAKVKSAQKMDASVDRSSAGRRVYDTVELFEHILHYLPSSEIVEARQLSRYASSLIMTSKKLHRAIFTNTTLVIRDVNKEKRFKYFSRGDEFVEERYVIYHGSWVKSFNYGNASRIRTIHNALCPPILNSIIRSGAASNGFSISFNAVEFLNNVQLRQEWHSDELVIGPNVFRFLLWLEGTAWGPFMTYYNDELSIGRLYELLSDEEDIRLAQSQEGGRFEVTLEFRDDVLKDHPVVQIAEKTWKMPTPNKKGYKQSEDEKKLKAAIEAAGKEMVAKLKR